MEGGVETTAETRPLCASARSLLLDTVVRRSIDVETYEWGAVAKRWHDRAQTPQYVPIVERRTIVFTICLFVLSVSYAYMHAAPGV